MFSIMRVIFVSALERQISVRAPRDELIQKGILFLDSPITPVSQSGTHIIIGFMMFIF